MDGRVLLVEDDASIREVTAFPGPAMILPIDTEAHVAAGPVRHEARNLITSLSSATVGPRGLMARVQGDRPVEDGRHFIEDRRWDKDRRRRTRPDLAERSAMLRDAALTALRPCPRPSRSGSPRA